MIRPLLVAAAYSWRLVIVAVAIYLLGRVASELALVFLALFLALLGTALLRPPTLSLMRRGAPPGLAAAMILGGALGGLGLLAALVVPPFVDDLDGFGITLRRAVEEAGDWLLEGPLNLSERELSDWLDEAESSLSNNAAQIAGGVVGGAVLAGEIAAGIALAAVITFFFLKDGDRMNE